MRKELIIITFFLWLADISYAGATANNHSTQTDSTLIADTISTEDIEIGDDELGIYSARLDSFNNSWDIKNAFRSDSVEVRLLPTFPRDLPDSIYIQRLQKTEQVIDLAYNPAVLGFIKMYTERKRDQVERMLGLSEYYFPIFEEVLDKYNLPLELKYLPIIESALDPLATSHAGAMGLWQFMYGTAKMLNMEITSYVDERRDPVKSAEAAAIYLKKLFGIYNDWHLAIAAYNCGPGNVDRAIRRSGGKTNYWEIYSLLPRETRGYVPLFIAATYVMNFYNEHNLITRVPEMPVNVDTIMVKQYLHIDQVAATLYIDKENLASLNPMYRRGVIPATSEKPYPLVLPYGKVYEFIDKDTAVYAWEREKYFPNNTLTAPVDGKSGYFVPTDIKGKTKIVYTVKSGDTVGGIAQKYKVRANDLSDWNNIRKNMIRVGQKLSIYVPEKDKGKYNSTPTNQESEEKTALTIKETDSIGDFEYYTVKKGDNVWDIAQKYEGVTTDEILSLNNISNDRGLVIGQKLKIRKKI